MKVRLPKHREFVIHLDETKEPRHEECWAKLEQIVKDYTKRRKSQGVAERIQLHL